MTVPWGKDLFHFKISLEEEFKRPEGKQDCTHTPSFDGQVLFIGLDISIPGPSSLHCKLLPLCYGVGWSRSIQCCGQTKRRCTRQSQSVPLHSKRPMTMTTSLGYNFCSCQWCSSCCQHSLHQLAWFDGGRHKSSGRGRKNILLPEVARTSSTLNTKPNCLRTQGSKNRRWQMEPIEVCCIIKVYIHCMHEMEWWLKYV